MPVGLLNSASTPGPLSPLANLVLAGDWTATGWPATMEGAVRSGYLAAEALLLGRRTYEYFAPRYPSRSGELADRLNSMRKYVVSATLQDPRWTNSAVLKGHLVNEVSTLKQQIHGVP